MSLILAYLFSVDDMKYTIPHLFSRGFLSPFPFSFPLLRRQYNRQAKSGDIYPHLSRAPNTTTLFFTNNCSRFNTVNVLSITQKWKYFILIMLTLKNEGIQFFLSSCDIPLFCEERIEIEIDYTHEDRIQILLRECHGFQGQVFSRLFPFKFLSVCISKEGGDIEL